MREEEEEERGGEEGDGVEEAVKIKTEEELAEEEEARRKEAEKKEKEEKELYTAAEVVSKDQLPTYSAKGSKKNKSSEDKYKSDKPGRGEEMDEKRSKKEQHILAFGNSDDAHSPDSESNARQELSLNRAHSSPSSKEKLKPSVPPLSKTAISPSGDRHQYTVTRAQSSFNKIDLGADGFELGEINPETPLKRPVPQGASPYTPSKKPVKSLVVSI